MKPWVGTIAFGIACSAATLAISSEILSHRPATAAAHPSTPGRRPEGGPRVRVSAEFAPRFGVITSRVIPRALSPALDLVGSVDFDADYVADVGARIRGRVIRVLASTGATVVVGTPLVEIESVSLGDVLAARTSAHARADAARARLARETELLRERLTTARAVEDARADLARYEAETRGSEQRMAAMGAEAGGGRRVVLRAPIAGRVIRRGVIVGQTIDDTDVVMRVAALEHVWVLLDVFERDLGRVRVGDHADITCEADPERVFAGTVSFVDATIDIRTRTARLRVAVDNPDLALRPGQFVTARVRSSARGAREVTAIPRDAVVQLDGRAAVFVLRGPREYEASIVALGDIDGDDVEVVRGLSSGDEIVTAGAFALKSELLR